MQDQDPNEQVFLDIMIGNEEIGRITIELFSNIVPKTAANFKSLCLNLNGKSYKTSKFHRIIKDFMIQGGDYENNDGTGGTSIYPEQNGYFKDENFKIVHDQAMLLSMANIGPNTNGSQFFITSKATPHLDKKHVVFGRIIKGQEVFRRIEKVRCDENDVPLKDVIIYHCGEIQVEPVVKKIKVKKIKEIESEKESSDGEENPYVIGVKPPAEFESSQSFLSGAGKSTFRVHKRPKDSKDSSGRTIRGRGTMKFLMDDSSMQYNRNQRSEKNRGPDSRNGRDNGSGSRNKRDLKQSDARNLLSQPGPDARNLLSQRDRPQSDARKLLSQPGPDSKSKPKTDLRSKISETSVANLQKHEMKQARLVSPSSRPASLSRSMPAVKRNRTRSTSLSRSRSPIQRTSKSRSTVKRNRAQPSSVRRTVSRGRSISTSPFRSSTFSKSPRRSISRSASPRRFAGRNVKRTSPQRQRRSASFSRSRSRSPMSTRFMR